MKISSDVVKKKVNIEIEKLSDDFDFDNFIHGGELTEEIKTYKYNSGSKNKKSESFNIELTNNDLVVIDLLAKKIGVKRSEILSHYLSFFTVSLFDNIDFYRDKRIIAKYVDQELTKNGLFHHYEEMTWFLRLMMSPSYPNEECQLGNDGDFRQSIFDIE